MVNWADRDWSYLLGVVHGDGHVSKRSIEVTVGYRDAQYASVLVDLWTRLGYSPKTYRGRTALRIDVHSRALRDLFAAFKSRGRWALPVQFDAASYIAGVVDTDGCVAKPESKHISILLKRSGNLRRIVPALVSLGIRTPKVCESVSTYKGRAYEIESIKLSGMDRVVAFSNAVTLRNPRKAARLAEMRVLVDSILAEVPLWRRVGLWLQEEPRTWEEIAAQFSLTKRQVDSVLDSLRRQVTVETIPPPKALSRFRVHGL